MTTVVIASSRETIERKTWLNNMTDLSVKTMMESHPLNEGFLLLSDNHKKSTSVTPTLPNSTWKSITAIDVRNEMSSSIGHLNRRLLNEPNDVTSEYTPIDHDRKMDNFLGINDEELRQQLINIEVTVDGSGDSMFALDIHFSKYSFSLSFYLAIETTLGKFHFHIDTFTYTTQTTSEKGHSRPKRALQTHKNWLYSESIEVRIIHLTNTVFSYQIR